MTSKLHGRAQDGVIHREIRGRTLTLRIDSPKTANALSDELAQELASSIEEAGADSSVRCIVLTGTGDVFCSGADLRQRASAEVRGASEGNIALYCSVLSVPKPVIARVNGHARAGGIALVACCDIAISCPEATFAMSEVQLGLVPAVISVSLQRVVSFRALQRYLLTGEVFGAQEAALIGLVSEVAPLGGLDDAVSNIEGELSSGAPSAIAGTKALLHDVSALDIASLYKRRSELSTRFYQAPEALDGMRAFLEKRSPAWKVKDDPAL